MTSSRTAALCLVLLAGLVGCSGEDEPADAAGTASATSSAPQSTAQADPDPTATATSGAGPTSTAPGRAGGGSPPASPSPTSSQGPGGPGSPDGQPTGDPGQSPTQTPAPTPEPPADPSVDEAVLVFLQARGEDYLGPCEDAQVPEDAGRYCSAVEEDRGDELVLSVGPAFSEFNAWLLLRLESGGWQVVDGAEIPYPDPGQPPF